MGCIYSQCEPAPTRYIGRWYADNGKVQLEVLRNGEVNWRTKNKEITHLPMSGWEDGECVIKGHVLFFGETLALRSTVPAACTDPF